MFLLVPLLVAALQHQDTNGARATGRRGRPITPEALASLADSFLADAALLRSNTSGAVVEFVLDGHVIFSRGYGLANRETRAAVDPARTLWRLASTSKSLTSLAILQLAARGTIRLDDDVNSYLRAFQVPAAFNSPITIRELLLHTSGLDDRFIGDGFLSGAPPPLTTVMAQRLPRRIMPPGSYLYSNYDYGLLGAVIEQVSGMPFASYMRDSLLTPLGLQNTTFEQPLPNDQLARLALPYHSGGGPFREWPVVYHVSSPGGGATATADDIGRYMAFLLDDPRVPMDVPISPQAIGQAFGLAGVTDSARLSDGFGWRSHLWNGERIVETGGDLPGYTNLLVLLPEHHLGMWVANNSGKNDLTLGLLWAFLDRFFPAPPPVPGRDFGPSSNQLAEFVGNYRPARYPHYELSKLGIIGGETRVDAASDGTLRFWGERWVRVSRLGFQREHGPLVVTFARDPAGRITALDNLERIPWFETKNVQLGMLLLTALVFIAVPLHWAIVRVRQRLSPGTGMAASAALLNLIFLVGVAAYSAVTPPYALMLGVQPLLLALLALPLISTAQTCWVAAEYFRRSHRPGIAVKHSGILKVFLGATTLFVGFLWHWNLFGYRW